MTFAFVIDTSSENKKINEVIARIHLDGIFHYLGKMDGVIASYYSFSSEIPFSFNDLKIYAEQFFDGINFRISF